MNKQQIHDNLVIAIAIMDEKGKSLGQGDSSRAMFNRHWGRLRATLVETLDMVKDTPSVTIGTGIGIEQNIDEVHGTLIGVKIDRL